MKNYTVRWLHPDDKENWLTMWQEYMAFYQISLPADVVDNTLRTLLSDNKNSGCRIACDSQNVAVGFLTFITHLSSWAIEPECYVHDLYVKPECRRGGVAKKLMDELKHLGKLRHWSRVYWLTGPNNRVAQALYDNIANREPWIVYTMFD